MNASHAFKRHIERRGPGVVERWRLAGHGLKVSGVMALHRGLLPVQDKNHLAAAGFKGIAPPWLPIRQMKNQKK